MEESFAGESSHASESPRLPGNSVQSECFEVNGNGEGGEAQDDQSLLSGVFVSNNENRILILSIYHTPVSDLRKDERIG